MTWCDEIDSAMTGYTANDVLFWLRHGEGMFFASGDLHASLHIDVEGLARVAHMAGTWTDEDAEWIITTATKRLKDIGIDEMQVDGRPGWKRFLRMKGFMKWE